MADKSKDHGTPVEIDETELDGVQGGRLETTRTLTVTGSSISGNTATAEVSTDQIIVSLSDVNQTS